MSERVEGRVPFSNGTEGMSWQNAWCDRCMNDKEFRDTGEGSGCPIWLDALLGNTPAEFREDHPLGLSNRYTCTSFDQDVDAEPPGPFDLVVGTVSVHWPSDNEEQS